MPGKQVLVAHRNRWTVGDYLLGRLACSWDSSLEILQDTLQLGR
jgi:hypothetical protein